MNRVLLGRMRWRTVKHTLKKYYKEVHLCKDLIDDDSFYVRCEIPLALLARRLSAREPWFYEANIVEMHYLYAQTLDGLFRHEFGVGVAVADPAEEDFKSVIICFFDTDI